MKNLYQKFKNKMIFLYSKLNSLMLSIMVLGILEIGIYYEVLISIVAFLAPEIAPIIVVAFIWILYKGIKRLYQESKRKKCILF